VCRLKGGRSQEWLPHLFCTFTLTGAILTGAALLGQTPGSVAAKARADFEKVDAEPIPTIVSTLACVQSNAAALPAVRPDERYLYYYRKGYCELFGALPSAASDSFQAAARDFAEAVANWPKKAPAPPPAGLRALIAISHLEQGREANSYPDTARDLAAVVAEPACAPTPIMASRFCNAVVDTARTWLGWLAFTKGDFAEAARVLEPLGQRNPPSPWALWIAGRLEQQKNRIDEAKALYEKALAAWEAVRKSPSPDVVTLLGPALDPAAIEYQLAVADYSRQQYDSAITHLDTAIKGSPRNSYAIFLRGLCKEGLHLNVAAMEDYALAAQTARASHETTWNVGEANYHRGVLLYQAKDYARAEAEFANALGGRLGDLPSADVTAWRIMAGVAARGCGAGLDQLESAGQAASSQFPKDQATALVFDCRLKQATTLEQYVALEKAYTSRLDPATLQSARAKISNGYADRGVAAEDRKDPNTAVLEYRQAIGWNAANTKAHFNLGAIYIGNKRYDLAEAEFRALVQADGNDFEAHYWLAESILAQHPAADRVAAACALLARAISTPDHQKKADFSKALAAAGCGAATR
jgi:tetratricopeptide (TPR) repeat protein